MHGLAVEGSRPLTEEERKAADRDTPVGQRVYAPASERVAKTVPDYRDVVEHVDTHTPERQAVAQSAVETEPSFTRVPRPSSDTGTMTSTMPETEFTSSAMPGPPATGYTPSSYSSSYSSTDWAPQSSRGLLSFMPMGVGGMALCVCGGIGVWMWMRWRRERNRPINRMRRSAKHAANQLRTRMPELEFPEEAAKPSIGVGTALLSLALVLWQRSQQRPEMESRARDVRHRADKMSRRANRAINDTDWQDRLTHLKERWTPGRIELEKVSIPRR